jgi:hypothetical protein
MKKPSNRNERSQTDIIANVEDPCILQLLVETLAESKPNLPFRAKRVHRGWKVLDSSSIEARVSGGINFSDEKAVDIPFVTCFLFTCIKGKGKYELKWSNSLS